MSLAKQLAYSTEETLLFTRDCAARLKDTDGDYVECGVAAGGQVIAMAVGAPNKIIHAFDSFEGIPLPSNKDDQMPGIKFLTTSEQLQLPNPGSQKLESSGATAVPEHEFIFNIRSAVPDIKIVIHRGWFENTVEKADIEKIALLRLDGDLYNSTMVCLKALFPKVISGGIVIIDDWQLAGCRLACEDYFQSINYVPAYFPISNTVYFKK